MLYNYAKTKYYFNIFKEIKFIKIKKKESSTPSYFKIKKNISIEYHYLIVIYFNFGTKVDMDKYCNQVASLYFVKGLELIIAGSTMF